MNILRTTSAGDKVKTMTTLFVLGFVFVFTTVLCRITPPMGDDVLFQFTTGPTHYLDNTNLGLGERITSLADLRKSLAFAYMNWTGRMVGYAIQPLLSLVGETITSVFQGIVFTSLVWIVGLNIAGEGARLLRRPMLLMTNFLVLFLFNVASDFNLLITFTGHYVLPLVCYLSYYYMSQQAAKKNYHSSPRSIIGLNLLGLVAGFSHEMVGLLFLITMGVQVAMQLFIKRTVGFWVAVKHHFVLIFAWIVSSFSPGNLARMGSSHDYRPGATSYGVRLWETLQIHLRAFMLHGLAGHILQSLLVLLTLVYFILLVKQKRLAAFLTRNYHLLAALVIIPFVWPIFGYTPHYATSAWVTVVYILQLFIILMAQPKGISEKWQPLVQTAGVLGCLVGAVLIVTLNAPWMADLAGVTYRREALVADAIARGATSVHVPLYPLSTNNVYTHYNYCNLEENYATDYYRCFYGTQLIPSSDVL